MSKKQWKQRKRFPWPVMVFGGILLIVAAFLFANQKGSGGDEGGGPPQIAVDQPKIDYGYVKFGNNEQFDIKVTNKGTGTLRFKEQPYIEVLEGC